MTVPTTELGGTVATGFAFVCAGASAGFVALKAFTSVGAFLAADFGTGMGARVAAGPGFLPLVAFATARGASVAATGAADGDWADFAKTRLAAAGTATEVAFLAATTATSAAFLTGLRGAACC